MTKIPGIFFTVLFAFSGLLLAQNVQPKAAWQKVRDQQPKALHLKIKLARDHFFQGEEIDATLEFSNDDPKIIYSLEVGANYPGAIFHAIDEKGREASDPIKWSQGWFPSAFDGFVAMKKLGQYALNVPINENVRFDTPGVFQIYAEAHLNMGTDFSNPDSIALVSDPITITITPIKPEEERQVIAEAVPKISMIDSTSGLDKATQEGVNELKYLQTPLARAELIKLMTRSQLVEPAMWGLLAAPDPSVEARHVLSAVQSGKLILDPYGVTLYSELKASSLLQRIPFPRDPSKPETQKLIMAMRQAMDQARQEITTDMVKAPGGGEGAHAKALWTAFDEMMSQREMPGDPDPDGGAARKAVAEHQLELPREEVKRLFTYWSSYGSSDFLPLVLREVQARGNNPSALLALCDINPEEARPLVLAEMTRADSNFFKGSYAYETLLFVPPLPLPELDGLFKSKLADAYEPPTRIIPLIACFGSPTLLPAVQDLYQHHSTAYPWGPEDKMHLYFYWVRCDPQAAAADFEHDFNSGDRECWTFLSMILSQKWSDVVMPLVRVVLKNDKTADNSQVIDLMLKHGADTDLDTIIEALEHRKDDKNYSKAISHDVHKILNDTRWHLTDAQKKRLEVMAK